MKAYFEQNVPQNFVYDAVGRRNGKSHSGGVGSSSSSPSSPTMTRQKEQQQAPPTREHREQPKTRASKSQPCSPLKNTTNTNKRQSQKTEKDMAKDRKIKELQNVVAKLQSQLDRSEQERDFYFNKLR